MEITKELRTLAKFTAGPIPVISVYLNTQWRDPQQRARVTTFFERHLHQARALEPETAAARESLARDLERLTHWGQQYLQSPGESTMPGVALFACSCRLVGRMSIAHTVRGRIHHCRPPDAAPTRSPGRGVYQGALRHGGLARRTHL